MYNKASQLCLTCIKSIMWDLLTQLHSDIRTNSVLISRFEGAHRSSNVMVESVCVSTIHCCRMLAGGLEDKWFYLNRW